MGFWSGKRVMVTGGAGFLGTHVVQRLRRAEANIFVPRKRDYDFVNPSDAARCLAEHPADIVFHAAAFYGGIGINQTHPARIFYENVMMGVGLMEAARNAGVKKFVTIGTACSYPGYLDGDLKEADLWAGPLHESVVNYGLTKKLLAVQGAAYAKQYGFKSIHLILTNLYGPHDCYRPERSHVVAALIRKWVEATENGAATVTVWGTGRPVREFIYVEDAADAIVRAAERYDDPTMPLNVGTGIGTSIRELVETIHAVTRYDGKIVWGRHRP
jgi:nucleoside-diphosphate-sugar epimerase